jgi:Tfp pilus assembly protein PilF
MSRIPLLKGFIESDPNDSFSRYALALEYVKANQQNEAVREFETLTQRTPDYLATYFQLGKLYQQLNRVHDAEKTFRTGITVAIKTRDDHTRSELESALEQLLGGVL